MPEIQGYIGISPDSNNNHVWLPTGTYSDENGWWNYNFYQRIRTSYADLSENEFIRKLDKDETLVSITFGPRSTNPASGWFHAAESDYSGTDTCTIYIQDSDGNNSKSLFTLSHSRKAQGYFETQSNKTYNISGGSVYAGKRVQLYITGDRAFWVEYGLPVLLTTNYGAQTVTISHTTGGTATINSGNSTTLARGETATINVTVNEGYVLKGFTTDNGSFTTVTNNSVYTFTMGDNGTPTNILVKFHPIVNSSDIIQKTDMDKLQTYVSELGYGTLTSVTQGQVIETSLGNEYKIDQINYADIITALWYNEEETEMVLQNTIVTGHGHTAYCYRIGRLAFITITTGTLDAALAADAAIVTLPEDYRPIEIAEALNTTDTTKRIRALTNGNIVCVSALAMSATVRVSFCYITAS